MPRRLHIGDGATVFHVMNRAMVGAVLFDSPKAYRAFIELMAEALQLHPIRILAYCLMPNHWHFILWPEHDRQITSCIGWLTMTHAKRLRANSRSEGSGPVYRERFKVVAVRAEIGLYRVIRYVERNPVGAGLVERPEDWPWSSAWRNESRIMLAEWPTPRPAGWLHILNQEEPPHELARLRAELHGALQGKARLF